LLEDGAAVAVFGARSKALMDALDLDLVRRNAAERAALLLVDRGSPRAWSAKQLGAFLEHVPGDRLAPLWVLLVTTGCRRG